MDIPNRKLLERMASVGLSAADFSRLIDVNRSTGLRKLRGETTMSVDELFALARGLHTTLDDLLSNYDLDVQLIVRTYRKEK